MDQRRGQSFGAGRECGPGERQYRRLLRSRSGGRFDQWHCFQRCRWRRRAGGRRAGAGRLAGLHRRRRQRNRRCHRALHAHRPRRRLFVRRGPLRPDGRQGGGACRLACDQSRVTGSVVSPTQRRRDIRGELRQPGTDRFDLRDGLERCQRQRCGRRRGGGRCRDHGLARPRSRRHPGAGRSDLDHRCRWRVPVHASAGRHAARQPSFGPGLGDVARQVGDRRCDRGDRRHPHRRLLHAPSGRRLRLRYRP